MAKRLFVGGLSYSINDDQLRDLFAQYGDIVDVKVITDKFTGRSKGFGFVEMANDEEADKAISELNDKEIDGRKIAVNVARPREERSPQNFDRQGQGRGNFRRDRRR